MISARRASRLYLLHVAIALAAAGLVAATSVLIVSDARLAAPSAEAIATACDRWLSAGGPAALAGLSAIALAVLVVGFAVRSARRQVGATRRLVRGLEIADDPIELDGIEVRVVESPEPRAFCAGYLRPHPYITSGALEALTADELAAVVAHEAHHATRRDPLRLLLARSLAAGLFFVPILGRTSQRYEALGELAADDAALRRSSGRGPLASALLKLGVPEAEPEGALAIAPERVDHLMGDEDASRWRLPASLAGPSALAIGVLFALVFAASQLDLTPQLPLLLAGACMAVMVGAPVALAVIAIAKSLQIVRTRRA